MTPTQSRAARALLEWSQSDLAKKANLSESTIRDFEKGRRMPSPNNLAAMQHTLRGHGVILINEGEASPLGGEGVRFSQDNSVFQLEDEFDQLLGEHSTLESVVDFLSKNIESEEDQGVKGHLNKVILDASIDLERVKFRMKEVRSRIDSLNQHTETWLKRSRDTDRT